MSLIELMEVLPPPVSPVKPGTKAEWAKIEQEIGSPLPSDYKAFIQIYGSGVVGGFLSIWNPFSDNPYGNLLVQFQKALDILSYRRDHEEKYQYPFYPELSGLLPFADMPNGDVLCWKTAGNPEQWTLVYLNKFGPEYEEHECSLIAFLIAIIKGKIADSAFGDEDLFDREAGFLSLSENWPESAYEVISELVSGLSVLLSRSLSAGIDQQELSNLEIRASFVPGREWPHNSIQIKAATEHAKGIIVVHPYGKRINISIANTDADRNLYSFNGEYTTVDNIRQCLEEVLDVLT